MTEKTKNITLIGLTTVIILLVSGFLVLAGEFRATQQAFQSFQWAVESIKSLDHKIASNSAEFESIEEQKKLLSSRQQELHELNKSLRQSRSEAQDQFLSGLWLIQISQDQSRSVKKPVAKKTLVAEKKNISKKSKKTDSTIRHSWFRKDDQRQQIVQKAYQLWGMDLVTLMECENGNRDIYARGDQGKSYWICQMHTWHHRLPAEYFNSRETQVEVCNQKWRTWTKFYGPGRMIEGQRCSEYVQPRFYFD